MAYIANTKENLDFIINTFRGVAWVDCNYFLDKKPVNKLNNPVSERTIGYVKSNIPKEYLDKLLLKQYAENTVKVYCALFSNFITYYSNEELRNLSEQDIRKYLKYLISMNRSHSYLNQSINAIKFYFEVVLQMPNRFYNIERPHKKESLPKVISKQSVVKMIDLTRNIKHKCMVALLYSGGLRRSELLALKLGDIDSNRMTIRIIDSKGNKDRISTLSTFLLNYLRIYYREYKPQDYLFEGQKGGKYTAESLGKVVILSLIHI